MYVLSGINGASLVKGEWFRPEKMPLNLEGRRSTASMTLGPDAPATVATGTWLLDDEEPGAGIVWRVKTVSTQYDTETRTVTLEHIANTLKDLVMFGETKPADMRAAGSTAPAGTCYAAEALAYILSRHSLWTLGTVASAYANVSNPYNFNGDNLFAALETVTGSLEDCYWDFDLTAVPFTINFLQLSDTVDSEMRMDRNITTLRRTVDVSRMYTRFYPIGKNDLHVTGNYVSRNENVYGAIEKVETDQSKTTEAELIAWANERLRKHAEPSVTVQISGLELSESTGEALDHFTENKKCRVPLPEYGTTITEKVTKLSWSDKIGAPEQVTVTLANQLEDLASIINNAKAAGGRGGRTAAKDAKEDHAWFVDTEDHVAMVAEAVGGSGIYDGQAIDWSRVSSIVVDGEGIHQRVTEAQGDATLACGWIDVTGKKAEVMTAAADVRDVVTVENASALPASGDATKIYYRQDNGKYYEWKNSAWAETTPGKEIRGGIISSINNGLSTTSILGDQVYIGSVSKTLQALGTDALNKTGVFADYMYVHELSASDLSTILANIGDATIGIIEVSSGGDTTIIQGSGISTAELDAATLNDADVDDMIASASVSGDTLTLTTVGGDTITFSKPTSKVSGDWSGTTYTVSEDANGSALPKSTTIYLAAEGAANPNATVYAKVYKDNPNVPANQLDTLELTLGEYVAGRYVELYTGSGSSKIQKGKISTAATYNAGWDYGLTQKVRSTGNAASGDITVKSLDPGQRWKITDTYTKSDGTTSVVDYVVAAPSFTQASVYIEDQSGGTSFYAAGTSTWVYPGNGGSFTPQGSSGPKLYHYGKKQMAYKTTNDTWQSVGTSDTDWYYVSSGASAVQYYNAGSGTKYDRGTGYYVIPINQNAGLTLSLDTTHYYRRT